MPRYKAPDSFEGDRIYIGGGCWNLDADRCIDTGTHGDYSIPLAGWVEQHDNPQAEHDAAQAAAAVKPDDAAPQGDAPQS